MATTEVFAAGSMLPEEQDGHPVLYLILEGVVHLKRKKSDSPGFITVLVPGEIVYAERIKSKNSLGIDAVAQDDCKVRTIRLDELDVAFEESPDWMQDWIQRRLTIGGPFCVRSTTAQSRLYSISSTLLALMTAYNTAGEQETILKCTMPDIVEEMGKILAPMMVTVQTLLKQFSFVGLIDVHEGDLLNPTVVIRDSNLFRGYLLYLQVSAGLPAGVMKYENKLPNVQLSASANTLLDAIMVHPDYAGRLFEPDRSIVHLSEANLQKLFKQAGGEEELSMNQLAIKELQQFGVLRVLKDSQKHTVFINLRNALRLNLQRSVDESFHDITEFLCDHIVELLDQRSACTDSGADKFEETKYIV